MAVKIRLTRIGKKRQPSYRLVVADSRGPRDGRYIEQIGRYDPRQEPSLVEVDSARAAYWLERGAQPSPQARKLIDIAAGKAAPPPAKRPATVHVVEPAAMPAAPVIEVVEEVEETAAAETAADETAADETAADETAGESK